MRLEAITRDLLRYKGFRVSQKLPKSTATVDGRSPAPYAIGALECENAQRKDWVAVKEFKLSYYIGQTLLFTIYTHYSNLI